MRRTSHRRGLHVAVGCAVALLAAGALAASKLDPVYTVQSAQGGDQLGLTTDVIGDVNGDSVPDLVIGAADTANQKYGGYALVVSGADGKEIHHISGNGSDLFGYSVASV